MKSLKKHIIEILIIIFAFTFLSELILGSNIGYETCGQGEIRERLFLVGEIEYKLNNLQISGNEWEANIYNLSNVYIRFRDENGDINEETHETTHLTFKSIARENEDSVFNINKITKISKFRTASFHKENLDIRLTSINSTIYGEMDNSDNDNLLDFHNIQMVIGTTIINADQSSWEKVILNGSSDKITFEVSVSGSYHISSNTEYLNDSINDILLKGEMHAFDFNGHIWSNGRFYGSGDKIFKTTNSGYLKINILKNPEPEQVGFKRTLANWEIEIQGENIEGDGFGFPFWGFGFIFSMIPTIIFIFYLAHTYSKDKIKIEGNE